MRSIAIALVMAVTSGGALAQGAGDQLPSGGGPFDVYKDGADVGDLAQDGTSSKWEFKDGGGGGGDEDLFWDSQEDRYTNTASDEIWVFHDNGDGTYDYEVWRVGIPNQQLFTGTIKPQ